MALQPGMTPLPAFGKAVERELDPEADEYADGHRVNRDADGEPVGTSDLAADVHGTDTTPVDEQQPDEDALNAFVARGAVDGPAPDASADTD